GPVNYFNNFNWDQSVNSPVQQPVNYVRNNIIYKGPVNYFNGFNRNQLVNGSAQQSVNYVGNDDVLYNQFREVIDKSNGVTKHLRGLSINDLLNPEK
ncbi:MAG: hypothetical protein IJJ04_01410, partial [Clostridia bacterium]|nr:hypothetical protein [Clostridia bacterium]